MSVFSPLAELEGEFEKQLGLVRREIDSRVGPLEELLKSYRLALETEHARRFALAHGLRSPKGEIITPEAAARALEHAVRSLPELKSAREEGETAEKAPPSPTPEEGPSAPRGRTLFDLFPQLLAALSSGRLVIIGAFAGRQKELPAPLPEFTDWIDTARDGVHAIGNLPQRIRRGGVAAVIVCEQGIGHQHSDPVLAACRTHSVPLAFGGKGGTLGLSKALEALERSLEVDASPA